jgi:hypothetical protein
MLAIHVGDVVSLVIRLFKTFSILGHFTSRKEMLADGHAENHFRAVDDKTTAGVADEGVAKKSTHFDGFGEFVEFKR